MSNIKTSVGYDRAGFKVTYALMRELRSRGLKMPASLQGEPAQFADAEKKPAKRRRSC